MKKIKIFPAPHVEVRVHVSEQMEKDMKRCYECATMTGGSTNCESCSWEGVKIEDLALCTLQAVTDKVLGKEVQEDG